MQLFWILVISLPFLKAFEENLSITQLVDPFHVLNHAMRPSLKLAVKTSNMSMVRRTFLLLV